MSRVFLAQETALGRQVVIKVLPPELGQAVRSERFRQEIRLAARLTHPHIVPLLTAGESNGVPFYTMPFVEGESLRACLAHGPLPVAEVLPLLSDVAKALDYAHAHGVVHRDIKPDNVLLTGGSAAVTDFGVAKAVAEAAGGAHGGLTSLGVALGTPAYMAPEQAAADPATDHRADIYAFGCLAYEMLAGRPPFAGRPPAGLLAAHAIETPDPVQQLRPDVPSALGALVTRCLAKRPGERPQTAAELLAALDAVPSQGGGAPTVSLTSGQASASARRAWPALVSGLLIVAGAIALFTLRDRTPPAATAAGGPAAPLNSVAVLPFANTGGDPQDEYFSDGMTDELAHALAGLPELRVAGRTSSYAFKGRAATVQEVGRALGVSGVIAGSVRRAGDRLRVTVQLSSASDGFERWSHEYESRSADVFQVQDSLTRAIVAALEPALRGSAATAAATATGLQGTDDEGAYELYLRGRYFWERRGTAGLLKAIDEYRAAIARDPGFARAYAGLAMSYGILRSYTPVNGDSLNRLALAAARRALAIDSTLPDAHLALANGLQNRVELAAAEAEFRRATGLAPNDPTARQWLAAVLMGQGRITEALPEIRRAVALDPLSAVIAVDEAQVLFSSRRFPEAIEAARRALGLDSTFTFARATLSQIYAATGRGDSALAELGLDPPADERTTWRGSGWRGLAAWVYAKAGRRVDAERIQAEIARDPSASGYDQAMAALARGDREGAVSGLARSFADHVIFNDEESPACNPVFDPLSSLPSFHALLARYGIQPCPR